MGMAIYEYRCAACGEISEHLVGVGSDEPDLSCLACGSASLQRTISLVSINRGAAPDTMCGSECRHESHGSPGCACERAAMSN